MIYIITTYRHRCRYFHHLISSLSSSSSFIMTSIFIIIFFSLITILFTSFIIFTIINVTMITIYQNNLRSQIWLSFFESSLSAYFFFTFHVLLQGSVMKCTDTKSGLRFYLRLIVLELLAWWRAKCLNINYWITFEQIVVE